MTFHKTPQLISTVESFDQSSHDSLGEQLFRYHKQVPLSLSSQDYPSVRSEKSLIHCTLTDNTPTEEDVDVGFLGSTYVSYFNFESR